MNLDQLQLHVLRMLVGTCDIDVLRENMESEGVDFLSNEELHSMLLDIDKELVAEACGE